MANTKKQIKKIKAVESPAVKAWKTRKANLALAAKAEKAKHAKRGTKNAKTAQEVVGKMLAPKPETDKQAAVRKAKVLLADIKATVPEAKVAA